MTGDGRIGVWWRETNERSDDYMIGDARKHDNKSDAISGYDGVTGTGMIGDDGAYTML